MSEASPAAEPPAAAGDAGPSQAREERRSTGAGYYDLDAVLAEETAVPCAFVVRMTRLPQPPKDAGP